MSRIYFDTMMFIYLVEGNPAYGPRVNEILQHMQRRDDQLYTSTFTVGEVLAGFYKRRETEPADRVRDMMSPPFVTLLPFTANTAVRYGQIRGSLAVSPADGIHLACASEANVDLLLTNDRRLIGKTVPGIQFITSMDTDLL